MYEPNAHQRLLRVQQLLTLAHEILFRDGHYDLSSDLADVMDDVNEVADEVEAEVYAEDGTVQ